MDRQIDFLITAPTHQDPSYYQKIGQHTPILQLDRYVPDLALNYVISNDSEHITALICRLCDQYQLTEFMYFGGQRTLSPSESRLAGFLQGLKQANLNLKKNGYYTAPINQNQVIKC